jgi:hypothetical protein
MRTFIMSSVEIASSVATVPNTTPGAREVEQATERRTCNRADLEDRRIHGRRFREQLRPHQVGHERLRRRHRERTRHAEQRHHCEHRSDGVYAEHREREQRNRAHHVEEVAARENPAAIGSDPPRDPAAGSAG